MKKLSDLTSRFLPDIQNFNLPNLSLGKGFVQPIYSGRSILNIPSTICNKFGIPGLGAPPLDRDILAYIDQMASAKEVQRIVFILMDGLSLHRFRKWVDEGVLPVWKELLEEGVLIPLTSIVPSTTSAALTSLWTGRSAAEHGIVGYEMWMKEYGIVVNTVVHAPMAYRNDFGSLVKAGFKPEEFIPFPSLGTHLVANDVHSYAFQHYSLSQSGLSKMLFKDTEVNAFNSATDLWINLAQLIESKPRERMFAWIYWGELDYFSHHYGTDDLRVLTELANFSHAFQQTFLNRMRQSHADKGKTLLILTADHGEIMTKNNPQFELRNHPALVKHLHIMPTGEHRLAYLYVRPGMEEPVCQYFAQAWPGKFTVLKSHQAINGELFGPGNKHPELEDRLGDYVVIAHDDAYLWWVDKDNRLYGQHGGLSADEMLVPFLAVGI